MSGSHASHFDAAGCLTEAGVAAVREAPPGRAPGAIAAHLASCSQCQERLLEKDAPRRPERERGSKPRAVAPSLGKTLLFAALALAAMLVALLTLQRLAGP